MSKANDTIYLLSMSDQRGDDGNLYLNCRARVEEPQSLEHITKSILDAKVFYSRQAAWNYREDIHMGHWQITPISAKKLFTRKLAGK